MCFSATASFGAAALLGGIGIASLSMIRKKAWIPFGSIPLLFGIQQLQEGFLWLALHNPNHRFLTFLQKSYLLPKNFLVERFAFLFLIFAYVLWPTWIPFSLFTLEKHPRRKYFLKILLFLGLAISGYLLYMLLWYGASAEIVYHSIAYAIVYHSIAYKTAIMTPAWGIILYVLATVVPFFVSSLKYAPFFGIVLGISCITSYIYWTNTFASVWCFFAALLSSIIVVMVKKEQ